jgi:3-hydroxybutyryl-CoA dehydratase
MINAGDIFLVDFTVTPKVYNGFTDVFGDRHPLHTNSNYAMNRGFRDKVMHGNILNGFLSYFIGECWPEQEIMILSQEIKYKRPVYLGNKLILEAVVVDIHHSVNLTEISCKFRNKVDGKIVASAKINIGKTKVYKES